MHVLYGARASGREIRMELRRNAAQESADIDEAWVNAPEVCHQRPRAQALQRALYFMIFPLESLLILSTSLLGETASNGRQLRSGSRTCRRQRSVIVSCVSAGGGCATDDALDTDAVLSSVVADTSCAIGAQHAGAATPATTGPHGPSTTAAAARGRARLVKRRRDKCEME